jgi:hypothetical protein
MLNNLQGVLLMWGLLKRIGNNDNQGEISLFDVKELYDAAYEEKAKARVNLKRFKALINKAEQMDAAYRTQLGLFQVTRYEDVA